MKAFLISIDNWSDGSQSIYAAETAGKAKYQAYLAAYEAGLDIPITRFRGIRIARFDELAQQKERTSCIGWKAGNETWGCLKEIIQVE